MALSQALIYEDICKSTLLNWYISEGVSFEVHTFPYINALVLVIKSLEAKYGVGSKGDMRFMLIRSQNGKVNNYSGGSVYLANYHTPETVAEDAKNRFNLECGDELDAA